VVCWGKLTQRIGFLGFEERTGREESAYFMAELKFNCSKCGQLIACDELWIGHQINCPSCQTELSVPAQQEAPKAAHNPLVPQVPGNTKLSIGQARHQSATPPPQAGAGATGATSFRGRAPVKKKKGSGAGMKYAVAGLCVVAIAAVGYFVGYPQYQKWQDKKKADEEAKKAEAAKAAAAANPPPPAIVPPVFTLDVTNATIPDGKVNGTVSGTNFVPDSVRLDQIGPSQVLRFVQGQPTSPDREILVYLHPKAGETLTGHNWTVSEDQKTGVPPVGKRWKPDPNQQAKLQTYNHGYAMKLELGQMNGTTLPGKIFIALNDGQQTVAAGKFDATVSAPSAAPTPAAAAPPPAQNPNARYAKPPNAARTPVEQRYGVQ
jgi:hypothetical protein